jgi:hypothetical protein
MDIRDWKPSPGADYGNIQSGICPCGGDLLRAVVHFDEEGNIDGYLTAVECIECGAWFTAPTPTE